MKKKLTKENIKNWIKEHKGTLISIGVTAAALLWYGNERYKNGIDANTATSLKVIDDPEWFLNHDAIPLLIGTKANGTFYYALKEGTQFVEEILKLSTKAENL